MPKIAPLSPDDLSMGAVHGADGTTRAFGLFNHRFVFDVFDLPTQSIEEFPIFNPDALMKPLMIVYVSFTWDLANTNFDSSEISIGSNAGFDNLIQGTSIAAADNGDIIGNAISHPQADTGGGLLLRDQGSGGQHPHWEKVLSGFAGGDSVIALPLFLRADATGASAMVYTGTVTVNILWASLRSF